MKKKPAKKYISILFKFIIPVVFLTTGVSCTDRSTTLYEEAVNKIQSQDFKVAVELLEKASQLQKVNNIKYKYLYEAARIIRFELQNYQKSLKLFRQIILESEDENQRIAAQESITEIYLENLQDYENALKELQILEPLLKDSKKREKAKLRIAQTLFLTGHNKQALEEITSAEKNIKFNEAIFLKLKAEILVSEKNYKDAIETYQILYDKSPNYFADENLHIAISIVYEENQQYTDALNYLVKHETLIKDKSYYELRIKRLRSLIANKPLSNGVKK